MRQIVIASIITVLLFATGNGARAQDFNAGVYALDREDYAAALENFLPLAMQGNPDAQYNLGVMYYKGIGVAQDYATAAKWFRKAAEQDDKDAQRQLASMYGEGLGVPKDPVEGRKWYELSNMEVESGSDSDCPMRDAMASLGFSKEVEEALGIKTPCNFYKETKNDNDLFSSSTLETLKSMDPKADVPAGKVDPAGEHQVTRECITVSSREGWQELEFPGGRLTGVTTSGSWSVDDARFERVGPEGHSGTAAKALEPFAEYKFNKTLPFGALLIRVEGHYMPWTNFTDYIRSMEGSDAPPASIGFRINDTGFGDNGGSITVCLK